MSILKLIPAAKDYIWGGTKLKTNFNKEFNSERLAETWELSCHKDGPSIIVNGEYKGETLLKYFTDNPDKAGTRCAKFSEFPLMIKLIDARENLSIQVHPDNAYALKNEGQFGKTEMWYIVDCEEDSFIYYGFKDQISEEEFKKRIENNTLLEILNKTPVKKGDAFFIEAGTIHAITGGILVAEVQQSSNVTYRVYDYGRRDAKGKLRDLHVAKAVEVTKFIKPREDYDFEGHLAKCESFITDKLSIEKAYNGFASENSFQSILILEGSGKIKTKDEIIEVKKGDSVVITAGTQEYTIEGKFEALLTTVGERSSKFKIGIDLGGTNIKVGIVNSDNEIIAKGSEKTNVQRPWQEVVKDMATTVLLLLSEQNLNVEDCIGIGIGSPGTVDAKKGVVAYSNNFGWVDVPVAEEIQKYINLPVKMSNDANCAGLGEAVAGAAKGCKNIVLLTLGTGVGGGVVIDGKIFEGGYPGGAEVGHSVLVSGGEMCTCGRRGCIEAYSSATGLIRSARNILMGRPESLMNELCKGDPDNMNGIIPFKAARAGDEAALTVVRDYIYYLGEAICNMVNIFRPEKIIISGGVCNEGSYLIDPLNEHVRKNSFGGKRSFIAPVIRAELGNDAGIIGAANL